MTKKIDSSGSSEKERIRDEIDEQIREYLRKGGRIQALHAQPVCLRRSRAPVHFAREKAHDDIVCGHLHHP